ncbi:acyl-CoA thioesterase [Kutzneria sp. NPDC052558]|uniref:acyl-CoA thioesterase n=1 Tax=Kutzneria sp. NPDC052558 TaxID=3364121 RepID=UPI0037CA1C6E
MTEPFTVHVTVRAYETDAQGHLNSNVYLQYAEHARWELLRAAGINQTDLLANGVGPINLETTVRFMRESLAGDELAVTCEFVWGSGKTFQVQQRFLRADGEVAAMVTNVGGLLDLGARKLVSEPHEYFQGVAGKPELLGL